MKKVAVLQKGSKFAIYVDGELTLECFKKSNAQMIKAILEADEAEIKEELHATLEDTIGVNTKEIGVVRNTGYLV